MAVFSTLRTRLQLVADYYGFFRRHKPVILQVVAPAPGPNLLPDSPTLDQHLEFIKETFDKEDERKTSLEGKAGQLLGQAGLVLSLVAILTPLIADSLAQLPKPLLVVVAGLFIATILFFTNSVFHTALLTKVLKWNYMRPRAENIFKQYPATTVAPPATYEPYKSELVLDYYKSYQRNKDNNDQKANFLNYAAHSFATALLLTMALVLFVSVSLLFKQSGPSEVRLLPGSTVEVR
jgi:hypothetical protein